MGWYLRVLEPGRVPTSGAISIEEHHPARISAARVQAAITDLGTVHPDLAALSPLASKVQNLLAIPDRDLTGGVPETDGPS